MAAVPGFCRELKGWKCFHLVGFSGPGIKEIAAPALGGNLHVGGPLSPRATVEARVAHYGVQYRAREQLIAIGYADGCAVSAIIRRCALWNQSIDVREF